VTEYLPDPATFRRLAADNGSVPIVRRLLADQLTPVSAFARIAADAQHAFLLESVVGGEQIARFSFVGANPSIVFQSKGPTGAVTRSDGSVEMLNQLADPLGALHDLLCTYRAPPRDPAAWPGILLPRFTGGAVGYAAYDTIRYYERLPDAPDDDRMLDDVAFGIYDTLVIFDHVNKTILVVAHTRPDQTPDAAYDDACCRIDKTIDALLGPAPPLTSEMPLDHPPEPIWQSTFTQTAFESAVRRGIDYILAGDIFQVVLSQRLRALYADDPFDIYRALRVVNPSPFMFYLKSPDAILIGASPEILCRVEDGVVTNRPLAGTRHRGKTPAEDADLERALRNDPKDRAEHIMLVDLGRNDVGRVARPGTVKLDEVMTVERYSHVMHLSSTITGRLADGMTAFDALRTALPVGTVSGAPKIRAMQIIDELEPVRRGPYGGAVGYCDFAGNMDTCISLRTMVVTPDLAAGGWNVDIQAGAGIVADSQPTSEYEETLNKAMALLAAMAIAQRGPEKGK